MRPSLLLLLLITAIFCRAADKKYPFATIPAALLKNANLVKRMDDTRFEIISTGRTVLRRTYALTVLNEAGARLATLEELYDKLREVRSIKGTLYDALGNEVRQLKNKEVQDNSAISNFSIYEDSRVKRHSFSYPSFPYTVAYEVEVVYNHSLYYEPWAPQENEHIAVEQSSCTVICPQGYLVRYRNFNYPAAPALSIESGRQVMCWKASALKAIIRPFAAPAWNELATVVYLAPSEFEIEGYKGVMNTWNDLAKFHAVLNRGRDVLPANVQQQVLQITKELATKREKVEALYRYLQQNTRYISIQLGIGGWQPFEASYVAQKGYGDCKALSNYMFSLLKAAGIRSHYAVIRAGNSREARRMVEDFPMKQSNHVVLCVPLEKDTMWLECTSQSDPAGYMGSFTGNRKALLVDEDGGTLVSTPRYGLAENKQMRKVVAKLDATGNLDAAVLTTYTGLQQDEKQSMLEHQTKEEVQRTLNEELDLATYEVVQFQYRQQKSSLPVLDESLQLYISRFATFSGKRLFLAPNLLNQTGFKIEVDTARTCDFVFDQAYQDMDTVEIELPEGYQPEAMPQDVLLKTRFGRYSSGVKVLGNRLMYLRTIEQYGGRYPVSDGAELARFWDAVYKADRSRVVLVKQE